MVSPSNILLVEDNPGDVRLTIEALRESKIRNTLNVARDGVEAMTYLGRADGFTEAARPDLIRLDLNLPRKDGRAVLSEIKSSPELRTILVVIPTTSRAEQDVLRSYEPQANCYITKPVELDQFIAVVKIDRRLLADNHHAPGF